MSEVFSDESSLRFDELERLKGELSKTKSKLSKEREKNKQMKATLKEISLKCQLLEEENKLLQTTRAPQVIKAQDTQNTIPSSKVSLLLSDFDSLLASQNEEISKLISDRDSLIALCYQFQQISTSQNSLILQFKLVTKNLLRYLNNDNVLLTDVINSYQKIGIDIRDDIKLVTRANKISDLASLLNLESNNQISAQQIEAVLNSLKSSRLEDPTIDIIINFIVQQIALNKDYEQKINENNESLKQIKSDYDESQKLIKQICNKISHSKLKQNPSDVLNLIDQFKLQIENAEATSDLFHKLVNTFASFGESYEDSHVQKCVHQMQSWLQNPNSNIDVVQEIDFLLGMIKSGKVVSEITPEIATELKVSSHSIKHTKTSHITEKQISRQISELKRNVIEMKERLQKADTERRNYISTRLNNAIRPDSTWTQICDYVMTR